MVRRLGDAGRATVAQRFAGRVQDRQQSVQRRDPPQGNDQEAQTQYRPRIAAFQMRDFMFQNRAGAVVEAEISWQQDDGAQIADQKRRGGRLAGAHLDLARQLYVRWNAGGLTVATQVLQPQKVTAETGQQGQANRRPADQGNQRPFNTNAG